MAHELPNPMQEFTKLFTDMKLPNMGGAEALMAAYQRNVEALSAANRIAMEGAQTVAKRHMELMQQTMAELTETLRGLASPGAPQEKAAEQAELLKRAYERAVANTQEMSEVIRRANAEAVDLLNKRIAEALDEVKSLVAKAKP
jgi:phasin family protein